MPEFLLSFEGGEGPRTEPKLSGNDLTEDECTIKKRELLFEYDEEADAVLPHREGLKNNAFLSTFCG